MATTGKSSGGRLILSVVGGFVLLVVGIAVHAHYDPLHAACISPVGQVGQYVVPSGLAHCGLYNAWLDISDWLIVVGGVLIAFGVIGAVALQHRAKSGSGWHRSTGGWQPPTDS
jgi:hypothetical protein